MTALAPVQAPAAAPRPARRAGAGHALATLLIVLALAVANVAGAPYYGLAPTLRVRHPWHALLRPSGLVGQSAGILALLVFVFLWCYPLRKRWKALAFTGAIGRWLDVHVTTAIGLPLLLTVHAAWRADGVIGLGFAAMLVVCASGVVGRYLYTRIPRARSGAELSRDEVAGEQGRLVDEIVAATGWPRAAVEAALEVGAPVVPGRGVWAVLRDLLASDLTRWRARGELRDRFRALDAGRQIPRAVLDRAVALATRRLALAHQVRMLEGTQRVFRYWHVAHRPFALTALVAVVVHVAVVVAFGATWFY